MDYFQYRHYHGIDVLLGIVWHITNCHIKEYKDVHSIRDSAHRRDTHGGSASDYFRNDE